jgi:hypothetical protein
VEQIDKTNRDLEETHMMQQDKLEDIRKMIESVKEKVTKVVDEHINKTIQACVAEEVARRIRGQVIVLLTFPFP